MLTASPPPLKIFIAFEYFFIILRIWFSCRSYSFKDIEGKKYQLIELIIPGGSRETSKAVMYVDLKTFLPEWISVYDEKENERIKITFKNFQANPEIKSELFKVN
jgi:outer membrane lipoprotein-sorting protein